MTIHATALQERSAGGTAPMMTIVTPVTLKDGTWHEVIEDVRRPAAAASTVSGIAA
jgi:hypothetical protein